MTENLPAKLPPVIADAELAKIEAPEQTRLRNAPTAALAFALGYAVSRPVYAEQYGGFCALAEELMARPSGRSDGVIQFSEWTELMTTLPTDIARQIQVLYQLQRGQRWAHTGSPDGTIPLKSGNS